MKMSYPAIHARLASSSSLGYETLKHPSLEIDQMNIALSLVAGISLSPLISLIAGILILIVPHLLNYIVAIYPIIIGLVGLFNL